MRIALLTTEYPTESTFAGGIATNSYRTARELGNSGHDIEVFTLSDLESTIYVESAAVHRVAGGRQRENRFAKIPIVRKWHGTAKTLNRSWRLDRALRQRHKDAPFDIVQAVSSHGVGYFSTFRKIAPVVTFANGYKPAVRIAEGRSASRKERQIESASLRQMRRSDAVHAPSRLVADLLQLNHGIHAEVIEYVYDFDSVSQGNWSVPQGLDADGYGLFFGTIGRLKGCDRLVSVLPSLLVRHPEMKFVFVGRPQKTAAGVGFDEYIRHALREYRSRIIVLPAQQPESLFPYVAHARFVVLPSRTDNLPNTCLEAMTLARPVIATRGASFEQVIDHEHNGFLVSQSDDDELATRMDTVWTMDSNRRARIGQAARTTLDRFHPSRAIKPLLALYERTINNWRLGVNDPTTFTTERV